MVKAHVGHRRLPWRHLFHSCGFENGRPLSIFAIATFQCNCGSVRVEPRCQKASVGGGGGGCAEPLLDQRGPRKRQLKDSTTATCSHTNAVATGSFRTSSVCDRKKEFFSKILTTAFWNIVFSSSAQLQLHRQWFLGCFSFFSVWIWELKTCEETRG